MFLLHGDDCTFVSFTLAALIPSMIFLGMIIAMNDSIFVCLVCWEAILKRLKTRLLHINRRSSIYVALSICWYILCFRI